MLTHCLHLAHGWARKGSAIIFFSVMFAAVAAQDGQRLRIHSDSTVERTSTPQPTQDTQAAGVQTTVTTSASSTQLTVLFLCVMVLIAMGLSCAVYSICHRLKCEPSESTLLTADELLGRRTSFFHEDLLSDDEMRRLWKCPACEFDNYEHKTHCALCGLQKNENDDTQKTAGGEDNPLSNSDHFGTLLTSSQAPTVLSYRGSVGSSTAASPNMLRTPSPAAPHDYFVQSPASFASPSPSSSYSPALTPSSGSKPASSPRLRRKEWQHVFNSHRQLVWTHQTRRHTSEVSSSIDELVTATAFVSRVEMSRDAREELVPVSAEQALVYPSELLARSENEIAVLDSALTFDKELDESVCKAGAAKADATSIGKNNADSFDVGQMRSRSFPEKHRWFLQQTTDILNQRWGSPTMGGNNMTLVTPRGRDVLETAMHALMNASAAQLRRPLRVEFENEPGVDAGGLVREWLGLVSEEFLNGDQGLFQAMHTTGPDGGSLAYGINPKASLTVEDHLLYFRTFGRLVGKALLEGHLVPLAVTDVVFKHILGEPLSFADLVELDGNLARNLQALWDAPTNVGSDAADGVDGTDEQTQDADPYGLDFSVFHTAMGTVDLKPNGRNICVTEHNKREYVALLVQWYLVRSEAEELGAIVAGVHDVLPVRLLAPFDHAELRLLLCGSPVLDLHDWETHTAVMGTERKLKTTRLTRWFWRALRSMSNRERERILQFTTGSCRVPVHGFKALTTSDGRLCPFTLCWLPNSECSFPRAHTCFNRLDLPACSSEQELYAALRLVAQMDVTGFSIQ